MERIQTKRLVVFDLETTGTNPQRDQVIQVGAIALDGELTPCGEFEAKLHFDQRRAARATFTVNSFDRSRWESEAFSEKEAAKRFAAFIHEHATLLRTGAHGKPFLVAQLASYNAAFDGIFVQAWFERVHAFLPADRRLLCLMQRAHWALVESHACAFPENMKLGTVCRELGIPLGENAHDALHDARAAASLYRVLHGLAPLTGAEDKIVSGERRTQRRPSQDGGRRGHRQRSGASRRNSRNWSYRRRKTRVTAL